MPKYHITIQPDLCQCSRKKIIDWGDIPKITLKITFTFSQFTSTSTESIKIWWQTQQPPKWQCCDKDSPRQQSLLACLSPDCQPEEEQHPYPFCNRSRLAATRVFLLVWVTSDFLLSLLGLVLTVLNSNFVVAKALLASGGQLPLATHSVHLPKGISQIPFASDLILTLELILPPGRRSSTLTVLLTSSPPARSF